MGSIWQRVSSAQFLFLRCSGKPLFRVCRDPSHWVMCASLRVSAAQVRLYICLRLDISSLTNAMEQSPSWEANSHSASQEMHRILWNTKVQHHVHNGPPLVPILIEMHPVHYFTPCFPKIHSNIIFPSTLWSSELSRPFILIDPRFFQRINSSARPCKTFRNKL